MAGVLESLPRSVRDRARVVRLGDAGVPAIVAHPHDWGRAAPVCLWMHGRTVDKSLDPGRYARWLRAGVGVCAIDLPGHGEREGPRRHGADQTVGVISQALDEIDGVVAALGEGEFAGAFDLSRVAIGGMSMGGMVALRRLCDPHRFVCAAVEGTSGDLSAMYFGDGEHEAHWPVKHDPEAVARVDASEHIGGPEGGFAPLPLLVLHSEADEMVPWAVQRRFVSRLGEHFEARGASESLIEVVTWPETGAPAEHVGFGRFSNEAKNLQAAFLAQHLGAVDAEA